MIPLFNEAGNLPPGVHWATWEEVVSRYATNSHRERLLTGLRAAVEELQKAGCDAVYINGSFVTNKEYPADFDCCWEVSGVSLDLIDPVLLDFTNKQAAQKSKFGGELFPNLPERVPDLTVLEWFQVDKLTGDPKGIIALDLRNL